MFLSVGHKKKCYILKIGEQSLQQGSVLNIHCVILLTRFSKVRKPDCDSWFGHFREDEANRRQREEEDRKHRYSTTKIVGKRRYSTTKIESKYRHSTTNNIALLPRKCPCCLIILLDITDKTKLTDWSVNLSSDEGEYVIK